MLKIVEATPECRAWFADKLGKLEDKMRRDDAAARNRGDVADARKDSCIAQEFDEAQVEQRGAKPAAGERKADALHGKDRMPRSPDGPQTEGASEAEARYRWVTMFAIDSHSVEPDQAGNLRGGLPNNIDRRIRSVAG